MAAHVRRKKGKKMRITTDSVLVQQLMDSRTPKTEREHAAVREIEKLREELSIWRHVYPDIAPEKVQPDRTLLLAEIELLKAELANCRKKLEVSTCSCGD
jgi:hypothetical protein